MPPTRCRTLAGQRACALRRGGPAVSGRWLGRRASWNRQDRGTPTRHAPSRGNTEGRTGAHPSTAPAGLDLGVNGGGGALAAGRQGLPGMPGGAGM